MDKTASHLEYTLLGLLAQSPAHGYELNKQLKTLPALGQVWFVKQANLYALLDKLQERGLIEARRLEESGYPPRKEYALTNAGREALLEWLRTPVERPREMRQEFLLRLYFARQSGLQTARDLLANQRKYIAHWLEQIQQMIAELPVDEMFQKLVLEFRLRQSQAALEWLDWCERQPFFQE